MANTVPFCFYKGKIVGFALDDPIADVVLGNIDGLDDKPLLDTLDLPGNDDGDHKRDKPRNQNDGVTTLAAGNDTHTDSLTVLLKDLNSDTFRKEQLSDPNLLQIRNKATNNDTYTLHDGLIYKIQHTNQPLDVLVIPTIFRQRVLAVCHDCPMSGHLDVAATKRRVTSRFTWPDIVADIKNFVWSCDICQRIAPRQPKFQYRRWKLLISHSKKFQ